VPAAATGVIQPPRTGDAGLAGGSDERLYAGTLLIAASLFGAGLVLRRR
jgi:hypothetical protein